VTKRDYVFAIADALRTEYQAMIDDVTKEIVAEDSRLARWKGTIFLRRTTYIRPQ